jgi:single-strand DNA-binding protein
MINEVRIIGRLGTNPEVKQTQNGGMLAKLSVGTTEVWKDKDGNRQEETSWHNVTLFGKAAENAEKILQKGSLVYIEGKLKYNTVNKEDGSSVKYTDINARDFRILTDGKKSEGNAPSTSQNASQPSSQRPEPQLQHTTSGTEDADDDLPF